MLGLMQDAPLAVNGIYTRARRYYGDKEVVTATVGGGLDRSTYAAVCADARRVVGYLDSVGVSPDGRVGTFAWNTARHLALYLGIPASGRVMHTVNIRYFADQLVYTVEHAEDEVIFVDRSLLPLLAPHLPRFGTVRHVVVMDDGAGTELPDDPRVVRWQDVIDTAEPIEPDDHVTDERQAAALCYTTGTTGMPKGVLYSHRSAWLHANLCTTTATFALSDRDRVLPIVPMFHANAWGLPYGSLLAGAALILPGPDLSPDTLATLLEDERVTVGAGVPTIWMGLLPRLRGRDLTLRKVLSGGSVIPKSLSEAYRSTVGVPIQQAWGMTETSPIASSGVVRAEFADLPEDEQADIRALAGVAPPGVELRIVDTETRAEQPWDDTATGELEARGPWIASQYYRADTGEQFSADGWLRTGDVASISPLGYVRLVDRTKDLVKSGGEWISSVDLENAIMDHPRVAEAAVIAVPHPKWSERPLACVVVAEGEQLTRDEVLDFVAARFDRWQVPDDVVFVDELPRTSVGKFSKKTLREIFADYRLPTA